MPAITIRDVPPEVRDELAARAARSGRSLQEHLRLQLIELAARPDNALAAPHLLHVEIASALRRPVAAGQLSSEAAALAHDDALRLAVEPYAYEPVADRVWDLREALAPYDGWYVALAETLDVPLATLDARLARSHAPTCLVRTPAAPG